MDPGTILAVIEVSGTVLGKIWKYYSGVKDAREDIDKIDGEVQDTLKICQELQELVRSSPELRRSGSLNESINRTLSDIRDLEKKLEPGKRHRFFNKVNTKALKWPLDKNEVHEVVNRLERFKSAATTFLMLDQTSLLTAAEVDRQLTKLPIAEGATFDSYRLQHKPKCLPNTRTDLLAQIEAWSSTTSKHFWWLSGVAGSGKSTIARTVAARFSVSKEHCLAGNFFFSRGNGDLGHAGKFVTTLAKQLANAGLESPISNALSSLEDLPRQGLRNQWKSLIYDPLQAASPADARKYVFLVDALDECESEEDVRLILQLLLDLKELPTANVKVFVTSRPETPIRLGFANIPSIFHQDLRLGDIPLHIVEHDIKLFLERELHQIGVERQLMDWPNEADISTLVKSCNALFIYADTVCRFVGDQDDLPEERLSMVLEENSEQPDLPELDKMYTQILKHSVIRNRSGTALDRIISQFQGIVGNFMTLLDVLSAEDLSVLLDVSLDKVRAAFNPLHSLFYVPQHAEEPIRALHPSFQDFLLSSERCSDSRFRVDGDCVHGILAKQCLSLLIRFLRKDICSLQASGTMLEDVPPSEIEAHLPKSVQYACKYWVDHLSRVPLSKWEEAGLAESEELHQFLKHNLLYWLEAMSLMHRTSESSFHDNGLQRLVYCAKRFILANRETIEIAPLQVYASALMFCPRNSAIWKHYASHFPSWVAEIDGAPTDMNPALLSFGELSQRRHGLAFSPDGKHLASMIDAGVDLRDAITGASKQSLTWNEYGDLRYPFGKLVFSPDGNSLAYAIRSGLPGTLREGIAIWKLDTGAHLGSTKLNNLLAITVFDLAFISNATLIVTGFWQSHNLLVIHVDTTSLDQMQVHRIVVSNAADSSIATNISKDGCLQALAYADSEQKELLDLWDLVTGSKRWTSQRAGTDAVKQIRFASNTAILLTLSKSGSIDLCDIRTGLCLRTVKGLVPHISPPQPTSRPPMLAYPLAIAISSNAEAIAVGLSTGPIVVCRWTSQSESAEFGCLNYHERTSALEFSPDNHCLASFSPSGNITVWNSPVFARSLPEVAQHPKVTIHLLRYHAGRSLIASGDSQKCLKLWRLDSGTVNLVKLLSDYSDLIHSIEFSKNGKTMVVLESSGVYHLWDLASDPRVLLKQSMLTLPKNWHREPMNAVFSSRDDVAICVAKVETLHSITIHMHIINLESLQTRCLKFLDDCTFKNWTGQLALSPDANLLAVMCSGASSTVKLQTMDMATRTNKDTFLLQRTEFNRRRFDLWFSEDGSEIETYWGSMPLTSPGGEKPRSLRKNDLQLAVRDNWVYRGEKRLIHLPTDYSTPLWDASGNILILGTKSEGIVYLKFVPP